MDRSSTFQKQVGAGLGDIAVKTNRLRYQQMSKIQPQRIDLPENLPPSGSRKLESLRNSLCLQI
jgi:hypothetical protein